MKRIFIILMCLGGTISLSSGQSYEWIDGEETGYEMNPAMALYTVAASNDGSIWFAGMKEKITSYYTMMGNQFLIHYDAQGNRQDQFLIHGSIVIKALECDGAGNLFMAGDFIDEDVTFWDSTVLSWDGNSINGFIAKADAQGNVDWAINLNVVEQQYSSVTDLAYNNGLVYAAHTFWPDSYVSSIDEEGQVTRVLYQTGVGIASGIDFDSQGNLYVAGSCAGAGNLFNGVHFPTPFSYNKNLAKYDSQGNPLWVRFVEDVTCISAQVKVDLEDYIYWTGTLTNSCVFDTIELEGPAWVYDFFLVRLDPDGHALWAKEVPQVLTGDATVGELETLVVLPDNSVAFGGTMRGTIDWGNGFVTSVGLTSTNDLIINYNSDGEIQWTSTGGGKYFSSLQYMDADNEGNLYITGVSHDTTRFDDLWLYKETFYYPYIVKLETGTSTVVSEAIPDDKILLYPNPATDRVILLSERTDIDRIEIIDLNGRILREYRHTSQLTIEGINMGVYIVRITFDDGRVSFRKLIKRA